ncbi:MAG: LacI family transcriptional regulator [Roseburia sp.]|nr:LacI family transcriptional regulator [Roseburia sp.]MCM1099605.1 LacI family transcriptional regulator [Ruminococcus flavefaciens]
MEDLRSPEGKKTTIYDIAKEAGVSPATVSRVLTNSAGVRADKRVAVQSIINKYNFRPNALARSLSETRRKVIGIIMADVRNPFYAKLFVECEQAARKYGYSLLLENSLGQQEVEEAQLVLMEEQRVDAIILVGGSVDELHSDEGFAEKVNLVCNSIPVILTGKLDGTSCYRVLIDAVQTMDLVMEHLLSLGHREIALIGGLDTVAASYEKRMRYKQILAKHQIPCVPEFYEMTGNYDYETGYRLTEELLRSGRIPTAVIGVNDSASVGAMNCIRAHGLRIPEDISVVSYDNTEICSMVTPMLTSIDYNYDLFAETLVRTVEGIYNSNPLPQIQLIAPTLVVRASSGPVREEPCPGVI